LRRRNYINAERRYSSAEIRWVLDESQARRILAAHPECQGEILQEADLAGSSWAEVPGFGRRRITFSDPALLNAPEAYAHRLLCRLDFLRPLARAALISSSPQKYVSAVENILTEWNAACSTRQNRDTVDDSIRILNLIETISLLKQYLSKDVVYEAIYCIINAAWNIEVNRTRTGNHLIYESLALMAAGHGLPRHPRSAPWFVLGRNILEKQMACQIRSDGFNAELSLNYHLITGTNFLKGWLISQQAGAPMTDFYRQRMGRMIMTAAQLQSDDGGFPALGDSDRMVGPSREEKEGRAFAFLGLANSFAVSAQARLERDWLLAGNDFVVSGVPSSEAQDSHFSAGGYYILSRSPGPRIVFDAGPFGMPGASHHGHADSLSFEIQLKSGRFWVDPGGFSYVDHQTRAFARSTAAHNTIQVDGRSSSQITGPFSFGRGAQARCVKAVELSPGFLLVGKHNGYAPIIHRRALYWLPGECLQLLILDRLEGNGTHSIESFFHGDAGWSVEIEPGFMRWIKGQNHVIQIIEAEAALQRMVLEGQTDPVMQGWVSPSFGNYLPAPTLVSKGEVNFPFEMAILVVEGASDPSRLSLDLKGRQAQFESLNLCWRWIGETPEISVGN
jgi:hypothetical protein